MENVADKDSNLLYQYFLEFLDDYEMKRDFELYVEIAERLRKVEERRALGETVDF